MSSESPDFQALAGALAGQYALEQEIGRGGMGVVYRARDSRLDRLVAIKTLLPHLASDPLVRERFIREGRTAAALSHPGIVPIHRADEINGRVFFVMGLVPGDSLAQLVRRRGRLGVGEALSVLRDVSLSLAYAHTRGVVHRDVKAENILLDESTGRAVVTDFGIARLAEAAPLTATGHVLGTVHYMSPEGVSGEAVDARSDLYALGVVGWFALTGQFPYDNPAASAVLLAHVTRPVPSLRAAAPWIGGEVAAIVERCLAKDPAARFASCGALATAIEQVLATLPDDEVLEAPAIGEADPSRLRVVSETEAQRIWSRAAELQADTTSQPAPMLPPSTAGVRHAEPDTLLTSGFRLGDVRAAAEEAGIPATYVERALAERGLVTTQSAAAPEASPVREGLRMRQSRNIWAGAPQKIELEAELEGELSPDEMEEVIEEIRRTLGEVGQVGLVGRTLTYTSGAQQNQRRLQITVSSRGGRTMIRAFEDLTPLTGAIFGGIMGGGGGGVGGMLTMSATQNPAIAFPAWLGVIAASYGVARFSFGRSSSKRGDELRALIERLRSIPRRAAPELPGAPKVLKR